MTLIPYYYSSKAQFGYALLQRTPAGEPARLDAIDVFRTRSGADHAANLLTIGVAHVEAHRTLGCRVVVSPPARLRPEARAFPGRWAQAFVQG